VVYVLVLLADKLRKLSEFLATQLVVFVGIKSLK
jgi:hypothetical protein